MPDAKDTWRRDHPWAGVYDFVVEREALSRTAGWLLWGTDTGRLYRAAAVIATMPDGSAILDVPCGGGVAFRALRAHQRVRYVAADISAGMLERAQREAGRRGLHQVEFVNADVEALPFADRAFDLCVTFTGLHCFPAPEAAVHELARCLRPGARLVGSAVLRDAGLRYEPLATLGRLGRLMGPSGTEQEIRGWLAGAGFQSIRLQRSGALAYFQADRSA